MKTLFLLARTMAIAVLAGEMVAQGQSTGPGSALSFNGSNQYVTASLPNPLASNYTICAWVFLCSGGNWAGYRQCVIGSLNCDNSTTEVTIQSTTSSYTDPQYLMLGRCNGYDGSNSTMVVPLNQWVHLAVTVSSNKLVSYFINGVAAGTWNGSALNLTLTNNFILADNGEITQFNGMLDEVQIWNVARSQSNIQSTMYCSLTGNETGLLAYWRFDDGAGTTATNAAALTGSACNGTLVGAPTWVQSTAPIGVPVQWQNLGPGSALSFNGVNQYVAGSAQSANLNPFPLTTMVWFKTTSLTGGLVNKYVSSTDNGWQVQVISGHILAWYFRNITNAVYSTNALLTAGTYNDGVWHHAALVVDTNGGSLYVDGVRQVLVGWTGSAGAATTTQPVSLGVYPGGTVTTNGYFQGQMDEISIWNVALTQAQIQSYMHLSLAGTESGLLAYWRLDDGGGTVATNTAVSTGSIYNGTLIGPPLWVQSTAPIGLPLVSIPQGAISVNNSTEILTGVVNPNYQTCEAMFFHMTNVNVSNSPWINVHGGLSLPGTNAWVDMHAAVIPTSGDFTVECWAQCPTTTSATCEILSQGSSGNAFYIGTAGGNIRAGDYWYNTGVPFPFGGWHHFAVVKSLTNTTLYVDGTNRLSLGAAIGNPGITSAFRLGRQYTTYSEYWPGQIDEVRVWGAALDGPTIRNWMWQGVTSNHPYYAYLAGYYPMNDGSGTNVVDLSRNGNTGTLISNVTWAAGQSLSNEVMELEVPGLSSGVLYQYFMVAQNLAGQSQAVYWNEGFQTSNNIFGYVTSDRMGVQNAQVTGSAGFSAYTDTNGYFCGPGGTQFLTITKSNVVFTPTNQTAIPGVAANFSVVSGTIQGHIGGMAGGTSNVLVIGVPLGTTQTNRTQSDVYGNYTLPSEVVNCDIPVVVQPTKAGYYYTPGSALVYPGVDANFVAGSTPPSFSGPPGNVGVYQGTLAVTNPFVVMEGTSTNVTVSVNGSSNPALVPFTPTSFQIVTNYGTNISGQVVVYLTPGAVGQTTISLSANDGINPAVVTNFTLTVQATNQVPVAGMPWAVQFDGSNNEVIVANFANAPANEMTVEFWQYTGGQNLTTPSTTFMISSPGGAGQPTNFIMASVPYPSGGYGSIYWSVGDTNVRANTLTYALNHSLAGQWNHFAFVSSVSSNVMQIYVNGVLAASQTGPPAFTPALSSLVIGPPPFAGALSEFRVWNVARTGAQILQNMNNPLPPNTPGMVAYYRFNDYGSAVLADSSASSQPAGDAGCYPYLTWLAAPTNFEYYVIPSYSSNNPMYLPGYVENDTIPSSLVWSLAASNNLNGSLAQVAGGEWLYTPSPTFSGGNASFIYQVTGPGGLSSTAQVFIHVASLYPPILSPIGNQLTQVNIPVPPILFTVTDTNMAVSGIMFQATADNGNLISSAGSIFTVLTNQGDTNETVQLVITPKGGAIGSANITVTASDGHNEVTESFILQVNAQPAYTIIDLGVLPGRYASFGTGINNQGQAVGYCTLNNTNQNTIEAFYYTGFGASQQIIGLETNSSLASAAYAINDNGLITGTAEVSGGNRQTFLYDSFGAAIPICFGALGTNSSGSSSTGYGINANGTIVGTSSTQTSGQTDAFISGVTLTDLGLPGMSVATGINNAGQIAGYIVTNGVTNAFVLTPVATNGVAASTNYLGFLCGGTNSMANGINQIGDVAGASVLSNGFPHAWLKTSAGGVVDLGTPANMYGATANGLNNFDQVVGTATAGGGITHAFLYSTGQMNDLNDLIPYEETNNWTLIDARGINDQGAIVGTGITGGQTHAFLALPAWVIGQPIARPLGTVAQAPAATMTSGPATANSAFFWNVNDQQLYAVVPCTAEIEWPTSFLNPANPTNTTPPIVTVSKSVWPRRAQTHVAGAPVQAVPQGLPAGTSFNYSSPFVMYATSASAAVDQRNVFNCQTNAYSVLRYISIVPGLPLDPINSPSVFQVVRSVAWNDPNHLSNNVPAVIGTAITNATHFDYARRNGYVYFQKSVYDGLPTDANRAYDLPTRTGPIIPVNTINSALAMPDQPLVVVWYHTNSLGVTWADTPYEYVPRWPAIMDPSNIIVIANQVGSGTLPASYVNPQVYTQNDATQPGFNPNEEHAMIAGNVLYALRSDLNAYYGNLSLPYVLLKYQDGNNSNQWAMRIFAVMATNGAANFTYSGTAGTEIQPPAPLNLLQLCTASNTWTAGPGYRAQVDGSLWAKAAGPNGTTANIIIHYWYPLQPGFYYTNAPTGACVPWLDGGTGTPTDVTYVISWPASQYLMPVGQTLTSAANGLPDITHLLNASIIFDSLNLSGASTTTNLARLYDPFTARSLPVPATATWTSTMNFNNVNGLDQFAGLPYFLRLRLIYDPVNNLISFQGLMADTTPGAAQILLNNVMSLREREAIKNLDGGTDSTDFDHLIDQLYKLTRNPNMLTLNPPGVSTNNFDDALLIGLAAQTNANHDNEITIVPETFGPQAKALTTGLFGVPPPQPVPPGSSNYPPEYITVVQDDPTTPGSVVQMYVIQISGGPALGSLAVLPGDNAFDQRLTMRHTDDFGGDPGPFQFQWYYFPGDNNGVSPSLPLVNSNGEIRGLRKIT